MLFSAFFSGMEIAFVSSSKLRFEMTKGSNSLTTRILSVFYDNTNNFISTMLVGNNIALVIYGILMADLIGHQLLGIYIDNSFLNVLIQTIISTLIILVTGEFIPKTLFRINPDLTLEIFAVPTYFCYLILYPISKFASGLSRILLFLTGTKVDKDNNKAFSKVDLDYLIQTTIEGADNNQQEVETEVKIFQNALDFSSIKIRDCMVPRTEIVSIADSASFSELKNRFIETGMSKIIVYKENIDNIVGYIHSSETFKEPTDWTQHVRELPFVPETMSGHKLMTLFMQKKKSLAVVVDEFGGTAGIVALEDLVEEIFGEIQDEHDVDSNIAKELGNGEYVFSGRVEIEQANEQFGLELPEGDEYQTIAGLILNRFQSFPKMHEVITFDNFSFKILKVTATKIELVKLKVNE